MCGIAGFSLSAESKISVRRLSNALLSELDVRGNQASGFAFQTNNSQGLFKSDVAGAALPLKVLPRSARNVILHTRYATHGSIKVMANNHPVTSPDDSIALVHNGVIYNHDLVRTEIDPADNLPEVDSSVIPAILQQFNRDFNKLNMLDGDAAVAWLDNSEMGVMRVARISHSPLFIAQLKDGSFVFASTQDILESALKKAGLKAVYGESVPERSLLTIRAGRLIAVEALPETDPNYVDYTWYRSASKYRNMTSGGHGSALASQSYLDDYEAWEQYDEDLEYQNYWGDQLGSDITVTESGSDLTPRQVRFQSSPSTHHEPDFPRVPGMYANHYGEYFERGTDYYMGHYQDLVEMGYISPKCYPATDKGLALF